MVTEGPKGRDRYYKKKMCELGDSVLCSFVTSIIITLNYLLRFYEQKFCKYGQIHTSIIRLHIPPQLML